MPISEAHRTVFRLLAQNRSPESYVAGRTLINKDGVRFSADIDLFRDHADIVLVCFDKDCDVLEANGYKVEPILRPRPGFARALVTPPGDQAFVMDWAHETSFRFFPVHPDPDLGWRLHWLDAAVNKVIAAASRTEPRDLVDVMQCHRRPLSLGALIWAAVGKDPGFSPDFMLDEIVRNARINPRDIETLNLSRPVDAMQLRERFRRACVDARELFSRLPTETLGHVFLDSDGEPIEPEPDEPDTLARPHQGSTGGAWPTIVDQDEPPPEP